LSVSIESVSSLLSEAVRLLGKYTDADHIQLRELRRGRWHQLVKWTEEEGQDAFLVRARPYFPQRSSWSLWACEGRKKLHSVEIMPSAAQALLASDIGDGGDELADAVGWAAETAAPLPMVKTSEAVEALGLGLLREAVAVYQRETERLRADLAEARSMISHLVAELENSGRGSQGQLLKLIGTQSELLADSWRHQGSEVEKERRRLDRQRAEAGEATDLAIKAVDAAEEKAADAEQESVLLGALMEHLGPKILDLMAGSDVSKVVE
jgi:hypothetical protein